MRRKRLTRAIHVDRPDLVQALHEIMPIGEGETPDVSVWRGAGSFFKKVVADYPNGWRLRVHLNRLGEVTSYSATLKLSTRIDGAGGVPAPVEQPA